MNKKILTELNEVLSELERKNGFEREADVLHGIFIKLSQLKEEDFEEGIEPMQIHKRWWFHKYQKAPDKKAPKGTVGEVKDYIVHSKTPDEEASIEQGIDDLGTGVGARRVKMGYITIIPWVESSGPASDNGDQPGPQTPVGRHGQFKLGPLGPNTKGDITGFHDDGFIRPLGSVRGEHGKYTAHAPLTWRPEQPVPPEQTPEQPL